MAWSTKRILVVSGLAAAVLALLATSAAASGRTPWTEPLILPEDEDDWGKVKMTICTCARGGVAGMALLQCTLTKMYAEVPWEGILATGAATDDPSVGQVLVTVGELVAEYEELPDEASREAWCADPIVEVVIVEPKIPGPQFPAPSSDDDKRKKMLGELLFDEPRGGGLWQIVKDDPVALGGISKTARAALKNAGVDPSDSLAFQYARALSDPEWNRRPYSKASDSIYAVDDRIITPAYLPRHKRAGLAIFKGELPERNIKNNGAKDGPGSAYGMLWLPAFDVEAARDFGELVITEAEPPAEFLALLE